MPHVEAAQLDDHAVGQAGLLCTAAGMLSSAGIGVDTTGTATNGVGAVTARPVAARCRLTCPRSRRQRHT